MWEQEKCAGTPHTKALRPQEEVQGEEGATGMGQKDDGNTAKNTLCVPAMPSRNSPREI